MADARVLAWNANGRGGWDLIHPDLQIDECDWDNVFKSPSSQTHVINTERYLPALTPWLTGLGIEVGGALRSFGIVTDIDYNDSKMTVNVEGLTGYCHGQPWTDAPVHRYQADPGELIHMIWSKIQSHDMADIGLKVDKVETSKRVGRKVDEVKDKEGNVTVQAVDEPFLLDKSESHDLGKTIDDLMEEGELEWSEVVSYEGFDPSVRMRIAPHIGRRRTDVHLEIGLNVLDVPAIDQDPNTYASDVLLIGAGEGTERIVSHQETASKSRLRRVKVHQAQDIDRQSLADKEAVNVLKKSNPDLGDFKTIRVMEHPACSIWSLEVGDEIFVQGDFGQAGDRSEWCRIISIQSSINETHVRTLEVSPL